MLEMLVPKNTTINKNRYRNKSLLKKKFKIKREEIYDNYFSNEDTIALANADNDTYFLDMGSNPLRFTEKKKINNETDFWLKPTFVVEDE